MAKKNSRKPNVFFPSLTQLRAFSEAARLDSISRASQELRRSQSAITQAIQSLEAQLGVALFARTSTGSYLTDMGRILQKRADSCFAKIDSALQELLQDGSSAQKSRSSVGRRITRSQVLALIAVDEHRSFARAAHSYEASLSALHRSARSLEQQIGRKLFKNSAQGVTTNEAGAKFSNHMLSAMRELEWAKEEIRTGKTALSGRLLVGALMMAGSHYTAVELSQFTRQYPDVRTSLINGTYDYLLTKLRNGSIDFLVGLLKNPPPTDDVVEESLGNEAYVIAVRRRHPLAGRKKIAVSDLRSSEWIVGHSAAARRGIFEDLFRGGLLPRVTLETHSLAAIFLLLADGNRMALLTRSELALDQRLGNHLTALNYVLNEPFAAIGVTVRKNWEPNQVQRTFLDFLRSRGRARLSQSCGTAPPDGLS